MLNLSRNALLSQNRRRSMLAAGAVFGCLAACTAIAMHSGPHSRERQLVCSVKDDPQHGKSLSDRLFDPRCTAVRVNRIVSGALDFASSL